MMPTSPTPTPLLRYWRATLLTGGAGVGLALLNLVFGSLALRFNNNEVNVTATDLPPEAYPWVTLSLFVTNGLSILIHATFFLGLREILLVGRHPLSAGLLLMLVGSTVALQFQILVLAQYAVMFTASEAALNPDGMEMLLSITSAFVALLTGILIAGLGRGMLDRHIFPRWLGWLTLIFAPVYAIFNVFAAFSEDVSLQLAVTYILLPVWIVLVCALLMSRWLALRAHPGRPDTQSTLTPPGT